MSKSTNVSVSMSPSCARTWRRLERSFEGDGAMLPVMVRGLADAWNESATAIGEASDALDLESRSVAPFTRLSLTALGARLSARDDEIFRSRDHALKVAGRDSKRLPAIAWTVEFRVRRYWGPDGSPRYLLFEDTGICMPREKASRGLKAFSRRWRASRPTVRRPRTRPCSPASRSARQRSRTRSSHAPRRPPRWRRTPASDGSTARSSAPRAPRRCSWRRTACTAVCSAPKR